jgi:hypothetical protein
MGTLFFYIRYDHRTNLSRGHISPRGKFKSNSSLDEPSFAGYDLALGPTSQSEVRFVPEAKSNQFRPRKARSTQLRWVRFDPRAKSNQFYKEKLIEKCA